MRRIAHWVLGAATAVSISAGAEEFQCPEGAKDSGYRPGIIVRWCEVTRDSRLLYHGPVWRWHRNGQLASKEYYIYGNAEGETPSWYEDGKMSSYGSFKSGNKTGLWKYWDPAGRIQTEVGYAESGNKWTRYYPDGRKLAEGTFVQSGKIGLWVYWDKDGKEKARCDFGEGLLALPNKSCRTIASEVEPKGYSRPIPKAVRAQAAAVVLTIGPEVYHLAVPPGWVADTDAGKRDQAPIVFYQEGDSWRGTGPSLYVRVLFKDGVTLSKVVANEKENFEDRVAEYTEKALTRGSLRSGRSYITKTVSYKPLTQTDSPFSIVSDNVIHERISFLDVSGPIVLLVVLTSHSEKQLNDSVKSQMSLIASLRAPAKAGAGQ